jgi:hypothetical protein
MNSTFAEVTPIAPNGGHKAKSYEPDGQPQPTFEIPQTVDPLLVTILAWPRPHGSFAEIRFRSWLAAHIGMNGKYAVEHLAHKCLYVKVPDQNGKDATTLFSCHIDTVDDMFHGASLDTTPPGEAITGAALKNKSKELTYDPISGIIALEDKGIVGSCLGADDGVGVWLMYKMIEAGVPGGYLFHTDEEHGGGGSNAMLKEHTPMLKKYDVAIAFDRPRCNEVITHQGGMECASDKIGTAIASRLNAMGFAYKLSRGGTFTDTKVYRGVIPECLNLGVGYEFQHGRKEILHYQHADMLRKALIALDWSSLPIDRDPTKPDPAPVYKNRYGYMPDAYWDGFGRTDGHSSTYDMWNDKRDAAIADWKDKKATGKKTKKSKAVNTTPPPYEPTPDVFDDLMGTPYDDILLFCEDTPEQAAETIKQLMVEVARLRAECSVLQAMNSTSKIW